MAITSLYKNYFQKSRVFLYPALDIKRGVSATPIETYALWQDHYSLKDKKLSCLYYLRDDTEFKNFEKSKLLGNKLFYDFKQVDDDRGVYTFDFSELAHDWECFTKGGYSKMTDAHKRKIKNYMGINSSDAVYIESFVNPEKYFKMYAELINVKEKLVREVGELCNKPELEQETLKVSVKSLEITREKL